MNNSQKLNRLLSKYNFDLFITSDISRRLGDFALSSPSDKAMETYAGQQVRYLENIINLLEVK